MPLLILDLDETLIHSDIDILECRKVATFRDYASYNVYARPHLERFLDFAFSNFEVGFWTAGSESYANIVISSILKLDQKPKFVYSRKRCTLKIHSSGYCSKPEYYYVKNLKKVNCERHSTLIVDDIPDTFKKNYGNGIQIKSFEGDPNDEELFHLEKYLRKLLNTYEPWHFIEKRNWRAETTQIISS